MKAIPSSRPENAIIKAKGTTKQAKIDKPIVAGITLAKVEARAVLFSITRCITSHIISHMSFYEFFVFTIELILIYMFHLIERNISYTITCLFMVI